MVMGDSKGGEHFHHEAQRNVFVTFSRRGFTIFVGDKTSLFVFSSFDHVFFSRKRPRHYGPEQSSTQTEVLSLACPFACSLALLT